MGCLLFCFELIFDWIIDSWLSLMLWIVPDKFIGRGLRIVLKAIIIIFSAGLLVTFMIGVLVAAFTSATIWNLWRLIFIPLAISAVQIIVGIVVRCISKKK